MQLTNRTTLSSDQFAGIESELLSHQTIKDVLAWGFKQPKGTINPQIIAGIVAQDEYSHDVIVPWKDGLVLVYDAT